MNRSLSSPRVQSAKAVEARGLNRPGSLRVRSLLAGGAVAGRLCSAQVITIDTHGNATTGTARNS